MVSVTIKSVIPNIRLDVLCIHDSFLHIIKLRNFSIHYVVIGHWLEGLQCSLALEVIIDDLKFSSMDA